MAKGVKVTEILNKLGQSEKKEFVNRVLAEGGTDLRLVDLSLEAREDIFYGGRRKKRKWFVSGKVIGVRVSDAVYDRIKKLAEEEDLSMSEWAKSYLIFHAGLLPDGSIKSHHGVNRGGKKY